MLSVTGCSAGPQGRPRGERAPKINYWRLLVLPTIPHDRSQRQPLYRCSPRPFTLRIGSIELIAFVRAALAIELSDERPVDVLPKDAEALVGPGRTHAERHGPLQKEDTATAPRTRRDGP
ncbi:DUF6420 family protein [Streptomyces fungicidicus]|uniref:DUF6420 family protein n=1 Tax=Streptomyces fungicidicus TaxID=68203 RepID=UPI0033F181FC